METKVTTASIKIALSFNYCTFETILGLENPDGIQTHEIEAARLEAQELANNAVEDYKLLNQQEQQPGNKFKKENISIAEIQKQPLWSDLKNRVENQKSKGNGKN